MAKSTQNKSNIGRVGLDIGNHSVKGVEVVERGSELVIRSAGSVAIPGVKGKTIAPDQSAVVQAIKTLWSTVGFESKQVVLALPADAVYIKWLHLEGADAEELAQTALAAATRGAPFPASDAIIDYRILSARGTGSRNIHFVMLIAASSTAIDTALNLAESAGLDPLAVDIGAAAALRSFELQKRTTGPLWSGQPMAHCIMGARSTTIAVVRGDELEFVRTVPVGGDDFTECIAEQAQVSWSQAEKIKMTPGNRLTETGTMMAYNNGEETRISCENVVGRLAREIQRSLRFFRSQFAEGSYLGMIGPVTVSGGGCLLKGLDMALENQGIEISNNINPFGGFSFDAGTGGIQRVGDSAAAYTTSVGLAIADYWSSYSIDGLADVAA